MKTLVSVTSKWQIHLPVEARAALGLSSPNVKLRLSTNDRQQIVLEPAPTLSSLAGSLKSLHTSQEAIDFDAVSEAFEAAQGKS